MPVGEVEYCYMGPVGFREFVAILAPGLLLWIDAAGRFEPVPDTAYRRLLDLLREFLEKGCPRAPRFDLNQPSATVVRARARSGAAVKDVAYELLSLPLYAVQGLAPG